jgi:glycosyltransferase involved in cell wall biosynthesis
MTSVLITSLNYAPEETGIAPYSTGLAEHLASRDYTVSVLTGMPHYPAWRVDAAYRGRLRAAEIRQGVAVHRAWHYVPRTQSAVRRGLYEATSLSMMLGARGVTPPDAVVGVVPSLSGGIVARLLGRRFGVPYGLVFQDLMGPAAGQSGVRGGAAVAGAARLAERWVASGAAAIGIVGESFRPYIESLGVDPGCIRRLRNWTHITTSLTDRAAVRQQFGWPDDAVVCLHAGNMGAKQGLENVIACARLAAKARPALLFVLMGDGNERAQLEDLARGLANVRFLPLQPASMFADVLGAADILLINQRGSVVDMSLPSKLTSYFAAGRPVVAAAAAQSETAREITASSGGIVVAPDAPRMLLDAVMRVEADPGLAQHLAQSAGAWAADVLSEAAALHSYEQLLALVLTAGTHGRVHTPGRVLATGTRTSDDANRKEAA